jgi:methionyl-tRNA formyltransferase
VGEKIMKILFIGAVEFSLKMLEKLISINANIVGVCTKEKSNFNSDFADIKPLCEREKIPNKYVDDINSDENIDWIRTLNPDIIFCFGWSSLIKKELLELIPMGIIGYHPTKLPQNRGRHPLIWSLALGLNQSASTFFFMDAEADHGDILSQREFEILASDNARTLYDKVVNIAIIQIDEFLPRLANRSYQRIKQNQSKANVWRKRVKKDGLIDFRMSSQAIYNLVRALSKPYVGAHLVYNEKEITIWGTEVIEYNQKNIESGKILESNSQYILVKTYDGAIKILEHEFRVLPDAGEYL